MGQRILLIESDPIFASEVKTTFESMGASVEIAEDGSLGIAAAERERPDLILLTIELAGMNGFLVCKKIKKSEELASVPMIILSSDTLEESFEQHKKLRIRAEEYLRKPIGIDSLLLSVNHFIDLQGSADAVELEEEALELDDNEMVVLADDEFDDDFSESTEPEKLDEVDALLEDSFPRSSAPRAAAPAPGQSTAPSASRSSLPPRMRTVADTSPPHRMSSTPPLGDMSSEEVEALQEQLGNLLEQRALLQRELDGALARVAQLEELSERTVEEQRSSAGSAAKDAAQRKILEREVQQLRDQVGQLSEERRQADERAETAEKRAKIAEVSAAQGSEASSSREALDLRDQLNRKEREVLDLRGQIAARDKQLLEANERALTFERTLADLREEQTLALRAHEEQRLHAQALVADLKESTRHLAETKAAMEKQAAVHRETLASIETSHQMAMDELREDAAQAAQAAKALMDSRVQALQEQLAQEELRRRETQAALQETSQAAQDLRQERDRLQSEIAHHVEIAERVRKAMAIGLGLLDQTQANGRSSANA